jgi:hypothetical protein
MKYLLSVLVLVLSTSTMWAQNFLATNTAPLPEAPVQQPFLTIENKVNLSILAGFVAADAITTQRGLNEGLRAFVTRGAAGEAAGSALGYGAAVGVVYLLHRTHHYRAERITMRLMVAGEGGFIANNIIAIR